MPKRSLEKLSQNVVAAGAKIISHNEAIEAATAVFEERRNRRDEKHRHYLEAQRDLEVAAADLADKKQLQRYDFYNWAQVNAEATAAGAVGLGAEVQQRFPADARGVLPLDVLERACSRVRVSYTDSNTLLHYRGASQAVECDDAFALQALNRHVAAVGSQEEFDDVVEMLGRTHRVRD